MIAAALSVGGIAAERLVRGPQLRRVATGTLYAVNPLVFDRIFAGHVGFLMAYALLPVAVASILRWGDDISWRGMRPALWLAVLIGLTPHFFWIGVVLLIAHVAVRRFRLRSIAWAGLVTVLTLAMSSYFIVPSLERPAPIRVGQSDLVAFQTRADPTVGLGPNVAGLYGFWRAGPKLPKEEIPGWPMFLAAIALLAGAGLVKASRLAESRHLALVVAVSGVAGFFLAFGAQGPTGPVFAWLFEHLPGFAIMREPQKFAALLALAYASGFGFGVERLASNMQGVGLRLGANTLAVALPVLYTPTLFFGLGGQIDVARYPESWYAADRLMGEGDGRVLFLPWHQYLSLPFTGHVIANPADNFFRRDVISGDNVELPGLPTTSRSVRSAYLEFLYGHGERLASFGQLVAPQGVRYVVVAKAVDWRRYSWLDRQDDLEKVLDREEIVVYRNTRPVAAGTRVPVVVTVEDWGEYAGLSERADLSGVAVRVRREGPGPIRAPATMPVIPPASAPISAARRSSPVRYEVSPGPPGWLVLAEPYDRSWRLGDAGATRLAGGVTGFEAGPGGGDARFGHWSVVRASYGLSAATVALVVLAGFVAPRRGRKPRARAGEDPVAAGPSR